MALGGSGFYFDDVTAQSSKKLKKLFHRNIVGGTGFWRCTHEMWLFRMSEVNHRPNEAGSMRIAFAWLQKTAIELYNIDRKLAEARQR